MKKEPSLLKAAWIIAFVTIISKFVGFLRDIIIAKYYGAGLASDAFFYANQIPSLAIILMGGVGGPFHSATVSIFAKLINPTDKMPSEKVNRLFNTFVTFSFLLFSLLAIVVFIFSEQIMSFIIHSNEKADLIEYASQHLRVMTPIIIIGGIIGIYYGLLITYRCFLLPNISPAMLSICLITLLLIKGGDEKGSYLAIGTAIGALFQFLLQLPAVRKLGFRFKPNLKIKNNIEFKNFIELVFPAALSSTIGQIYVYVDMFFASILATGAWTSIGYANRVFQFPVGILATAFLVPLFPIFSKLVGEKKYDEVKYYFQKGVGLLNFIAIPIMFIIIILAKDAVQIVFERGQFNADAVDMVSTALVFLSFAIIPYVFRDSVTRIFYSFNDSKTPFFVACSSIILKFILNSLFIHKLGIAAITLSTSLVTLFNGIVLGILIKKKINLNYKNYFVNMIKMLIAASIAYYLVMFVYLGWIYNSWLMHLIKAIIILLLYMSVYTIITVLLKVEYTSELIGRIKKLCKK